MSKLPSSSSDDNTPSENKPLDNGLNEHIDDMQESTSEDDLFVVARDGSKQGYALLPLIGKKPLPGERNWVEKGYTFDDLEKALKGKATGLGLKTGNTVHATWIGPVTIYAVDVDFDNTDVALNLMSYLATKQESLAIRFSGSNRFAFLVAVQGECTLRLQQSPGYTEARGGKVQKVEFLGPGRQLVVAGKHPTGSAYEWQECGTGRPLQARQVLCNAKVLISTQN